MRGGEKEEDMEWRQREQMVGASADRIRAERGAGSDEELLNRHSGHTF